MSASGAFQFVRTNYADVPGIRPVCHPSDTDRIPNHSGPIRTGEKQDLLDKSIRLLARLGKCIRE
ncbi:MAG: hypothetical protein R2861_16480 [Desulfobacterales bacterium]